MAKKGENIYKRKDGRWEGRYIRERREGKIKYGYVFAYTYRDVKEKLTAVQKPLQKSLREDKAEGRCLFCAAAAEWLKVKGSQCKQSSTVKYGAIINNHLLPAFGEKNITKISRNDVSLYISILLGEGGKNNQGYAPKTVNCIISVMKNIFEYAADNKGYSLISFRGLSAKQERRSMRILNIREQQEMTKYLTENKSRINLGILICLYTGLRLGEICALKWGDISLDDKCIYINKTMQRLQTKDDSERKTKIVISAPKSDCSIRTVPIPDKLFNIIGEYKKSSDTYVLSGETNRFTEPRTMQNRFKAVTKKCGIKDANFHSLRHTFATRCVELGFDAKSLSEILGHASVSITLNRYVHPSMDVKRKCMDMLSDLL